MRPQREVIEIHTTRERKRNAAAGGGVFGNPRVNKVLLMGGALAGGGATLLVAEKAGLTPAWAGAATGGLALAGSAFLKDPNLKDACFAAGLGGMGVAGVQLLASVYAKKKQEETHPQPAKGKRQADATPTADHPFVTRDELNDALAQIADKSADQHKQTCDLMTALHDEIKKVINEGTAPTAPLPPERNAYSDEAERNAGVVDEYMQSAYGGRNFGDDERNAAIVDEYMQSAYGGRNFGDDERNAFIDDERNAGDDERNASDDERNADVAYERDADAADAA
jgi:hypothetical protein